MALDICLVTKKGVTSIKGLNSIPENRLIVETSTPLALARMRAIQRVKTEWFAFIDDDVEISVSWYKTLKPYMDKPDIGAVEGILLTKGLGKPWDDALNDAPRQTTELHIGDRGFTHNTLIRTRLVRDWKPPPFVSAYEDYLLTQHVLRKGYRWLKVPTRSIHRKTWKKIWNNVTWAIEGRHKVVPLPFNGFIRIIKHFIYSLRILVSYTMNSHLKQYQIFFQMACIYGYLKTARHS